MEKFKNRFRYFKEKRITLLVLLFLLVVNILIIAVGCLVLKLLPENHGLSVSDALWESLKLILDPGGFLGSKLSAITTIVTSIIVLAGMVTFTGGVIGYVTNIITTKIEDSKNGVGDLALSGATVILNWNDRAMSIILDRIADIKADNKDSYIIVLSSEDKQELEMYIAAKMKSFEYATATANKCPPRVIVRCGNPMLPTELERINIGEAAHIFVVQPAGSADPDFDALKTYFSVAERASFAARIYEMMDKKEQEAQDAMEEYTTVVVETSDEQIARAIEAMPLESCGGHQYIVSTLRSELTLGKIYAQLALMPDLVDTCNEILSKSGSSLGVYNLGDETTTFDNLLLAMRWAIPLFETKTEDGYLLQTILCGERLDDEMDFTYLEEGKSKLSGQDMSIEPDLSFETHTIFIHGVNRKLPYILGAIRASNASEPGRHCKVRLVASEAQRDVVEDQYEAFKDIMDSRPIVVSRDFDVGPMLDKMDEDLHSLLVLSADCTAPERLDKNVFEVWMGLVSAMSEDEKLEEQLDGKVILELSGIDNAGLLESAQHRLLVVSNQLASLFMTQMAEGYNVQDTLLDLLSSSEDRDFEKLGLEVSSFCDLMAVPVEKFFGAPDGVSFISKQDCVDVVYRGSNRKYIPVGYASRAGGTFLFTNGKYTDAAEYFGDADLEIDMTTSVLVSRDDDGVECNEDGSPKKELKMNPEDSIIVVRRETGG